MLVEHLTIPQSPEFTLRVLNYEVGDLNKILVYMDRFGNTGYLGELRLACADALTMLKLFCEQQGFELDELEKVGLERFIHRMKEIKEKSSGSPS